MRKFTFLLLLITAIQAYSQISVVNNGRFGVGTNQVPNIFKSYFNGENHCAVAFSVNHLKSWSWAEVSYVNRHEIKSWIVDWNENHTFYVNSNGNIHTYGKLYRVSDGNFKSNIVNMNNGLETIMKLRPVTYNYNISVRNPLEQSKIEAGFISQEVQIVLPEAVSVGYKDTSKQDSTYYLSYETLIPYMVQSIQDQQAQIEKLEYELSELKKRSDVNTKGSLMILPNPNSGDFKITYNLNTDISGRQLRMLITNLTGQTVFTSNSINQNSGTLDFTLGYLAKGIYWVNLILDDEVYISKKIVIN